MKKGFVTAEFSKFLISGAPGTGKSSFLKLLYNDEPSDNDNVHNSTNLVAPRPAHVVTAITEDDHNLLWMKVEPDKVKEIIAGNIKNNMEISPELESQQSPEIGSQQSLEIGSQQSIKQPVTTESHQSVQDIDTNKSEQTTTTEDVTKSDVSQEIIDLLPHVQNSKELYKAHWIYGVDTGGQAAFLDIAPILLRYHSLNILTHKLDEHFHEKAKFFFSIKGIKLAEPTNKQITNLELLQASFRSLTSYNCPKFTQVLEHSIENGSENDEENVKKPHCIVLGTFYDKLLEPSFSGELLVDKNSILIKVLEELKLHVQVIRYRATGNQIIFPVNAVARSDNEVKKLAKDIRRQICRFSLKVKIPIRWFLFQLELDQKFCQSNVLVVTKSICLDIGKTLYMEPEEVEKALMYYHDMTIFLYFPKILSNVVFLHPQIVFDILSVLISISFAETFDLLKDHDIFIDEKDFVELKEEGSFSKKLLTLPLFDKFSSDFSADNFLILMTKLFIMAPLPEEGKYFLPTVLPTTSSTDYKSIPSPFKQHVEPLILSWDMKPFPRGIFPALVTNLLNCKDQMTFKLKHPLRTTPRYRNVITLQANRGDVLLIDGKSWLAIYYSGSSKECYSLRNTVRAGIIEVISNFQYTVNVYSLEDYFYCRIPDCPNKSTEHFCRLSDDKITLTCQDSSKTTDTDRSCQLPWFKGEFLLGR